jgi:hypothetical protein
MPLNTDRPINRATGVQLFEITGVDKINCHAPTEPIEFQFQAIAAVTR